VQFWSLLEEAFGDRVATGSQAVGAHNLLNFGRQRQSSPDWEDIETPTPANGDATSPDDDLGADDDELEAPVRTGKDLLRGGKRSAPGKTPAPKRSKREPISSQNSSALNNIAQQISAANSQREREYLQREKEIQERRPSWKRAWEVIQECYKTEWAKLTPGALGCLQLVLSQCPANLSAQGSNVTYADLILAIGNDKRRDKYAHKVFKLATELQGNED
jgi:hypothetical protein